jgi:hypothetical protein
MVTLGKEKHDTLTRENLTDFDEAVTDAARTGVTGLLYDQHAKSRKTAGTMWPGGNKYWIAQAIGVIDAICGHAGTVFDGNMGSIGPYYKAFKKLRADLAAFKG